jgi:hypothetical protein
MASYQRGTVVSCAFKSFSATAITRKTFNYFSNRKDTWQMIAVVLFASKCYCKLSYAARSTVIFLTTLSTFFISLLRLFFSAFLFSLFPFVQLRKWTLSQRVETRNGVKWRLASPGDSEDPAKPTLRDGNVLTERRSFEIGPQGSKNRINETF